MPEPSTFEPSVRLGEVSTLPASIEEADPGSLVVAWTDGGSLLVARSPDGGRSWEPATVARAPARPDAPSLRPSELARTADGSLHILVVEGPAVAMRSLDGGRTWLEQELGGGSPYRSPVLTAAGSRLLASGLDYPHCYCPSEPLFASQSTDSGATWSSIPEFGSVPLAGDADGNIHWIDPDSGWPTIAWCR